jgi:hypothetical protein
MSDRSKMKPSMIATLTVWGAYLLGGITIALFHVLDARALPYWLVFIGDAAALALLLSLAESASRRGSDEAG